MAEDGFLAKLSAASWILIVVSFHLFFFPAISQSLPFAKSEKLAIKSGSTGQCDLFSGEWIPDPSTPPYTDTSCEWVPAYQSCIKNGRPNTDYLHWKWKRFGCDMPRIDIAKFLDAIRNKGILFFGESVVHNQMSSLLCLISQVEEAILVYHDKRWQSQTWYLPMHNITLGLIWSPFLLASTQGQSYVDMHVSLDVLDRTWTDQYPKYDYVLFTGGQWFLKETFFEENGIVIGCHYCAGKGLAELGCDYSYRRALQLTFQFIATSEHKPLVIYRTWVPNHNENEHCNRTQPFKEGEYTDGKVDTKMLKVEKEESERALKGGLSNLRLLDVYRLSVLRPDGHPDAYGNLPDPTGAKKNDCLHWCLPGVPDTWNEMLMNIILHEETLNSAF